MPKKDIKESKLKKPFDPEEIKRDIVAKLYTEYNSKSILKKIDDKLKELGGKSIDFSKDKEMQKVLGQAAMILGLDNHHGLIAAVKEDFRPLAIEFANDLAGEYSITTSTEKALSQLIVNSYIRVLDDARKYNNCYDAAEYLSEERTKHLAMLSKQMDRAHRQFISALIALRHLKSPPIQVNIKTNTAFVAQNQ